MALIKTTTDLQGFLKVYRSLDVNAILPYIPDAQDIYIKPYIGEVFLDTLVEYWDGETHNNSDYNNLISYIQRPLARFAVLLASPSLDINLGTSGFTTSSTGTNVPASKERVKKFDDSVEKLGWQGIEIMLKFLEENEDDYPLWKNSDAYTRSLRNFINSAGDFTQFADIECSRLIYSRIRKTMDHVENLEINPIISEDLAAELKTQQLAGTLTEANETLLNLVKYAVANLTLSKQIENLKKDYSQMFGAQQESIKSLDRENYQNIGTVYLGKIKMLFDDYPDNYPTYVASDIYDEDKTTNDMLEEDEDDTYVSFGI